MREWIGDEQGMAGLRSALEELLPKSAEKIRTSVDLPLSHASKRILAYGAEEAERLLHPHIDPAHLLLGILRESGPAAKALTERGVALEAVRQRTLANPPAPSSAPGPHDQRAAFLSVSMHLLHRLPEARLGAAARVLQALCEERAEIAGSDSQGRFSFTFEPT
jgi:ATP-dependent Clp protease ATP-binding subunit ClpA